ncbi:MAG: hypothetical protein IJ284_04325, partial [Clostridia bacterium]|nr:hypothetical protein [Clostridia bacterium]
IRLWWTRERFGLRQSVACGSRELRPNVRSNQLNYTSKSLRCYYNKFVPVRQLLFVYIHKNFQEK